MWRLRIDAGGECHIRTPQVSACAGPGIGGEAAALVACSYSVPSPAITGYAHENDRSAPPPDAHGDGERRTRDGVGLQASFNAPYGACPECVGLGTKKEVDAELVVPVVDGVIVREVRLVGEDGYLVNLVADVQATYSGGSHAPSLSLQQGANLAAVPVADPSITNARELASATGANSVIRLGQASGRFEAFVPDGDSCLWEPF